MGYKRLATRKYPGLVILIIDQSESKNANRNQNGYQASRLVNEYIQEWILYLTSIDIKGFDVVHDYLYICCIVHESKNAYIYREGLLSSFLDTSPIDGSIDPNGLIVVPNKTQGISNLPDALIIAKQRILEWKFAQINNIDEISTPIILNFVSQPIPIEYYLSIECAANSIRDIRFPDGNPLLINILLEDNYSNCFMPLSKQDIGIINDESSLLYRIASTYDETLRYENERRIVGGFSHWLFGIDVPVESKFLIGGDHDSVLNQIFDFTGWFHLRGLE